ncbi:SPOR domain-containing protein [Sphingomonas sp. S2-65]|uniref:SPOR domain-containing protein n=1 Tax=Sphingomonas sp. S2-65 TaxID=2903960 RepID=UPI001F3E6E6C|nr:SPOR domain-containing protein [Sphingomonas sp. S2-65]UYY59546.1 SPOR domain-containing protein [Sphingomonas sp. S2-65]
MSVRSGDSVAEEDRLPWLETVEEEYVERRSFGRILLVLLILVVLLVIGALAYRWYDQQRGGTGNGQLIEAPQGDYKTKPQEPGGMKVEGQGDTVFTTSQGAESNSSINVGALPEDPVQGTPAPQQRPGQPGSRTAKIEVPAAATVTPVRPAAQAAERPGAGSGSLIQLGAFPNEGGANTAWARLSKRFGYLATFGKSVERAEKDGKAIFRLRVNAGSNGQAREICGRLKVAGESCFVTS